MTAQPEAEDIFSDQLVPADSASAVARATDLSGVLLLKHDNLYMLSDAFGDVRRDSRGLGLYADDTRFLSLYEMRVNGARPIVLRTGGAAGYRGTINLSNDDEMLAGEEDDLLPNRHSLGIVRERLLAGGFRERIRIDNFTTEPVRLRLTLRLDADFVDIFEVRGAVRQRRGERLPNEHRPGRAVLAYRGLDDVVRRTHLALPAQMTLVEGASGNGPLALAADLLLGPGEGRTLELQLWTEVVDPPVEDADGTADYVEYGDARRAASEGDALDSTDAAGYDPLADLPPVIDEDQPAAIYRAWRHSTATVHTQHPPTQRALDRGLADLRLLTNNGPGPGERHIAAGVPWFSTLFGRDSLITAMQLLPYRPQLARDTLGVLARLQATDFDDWRDAEPGKILHELRSGEMARAGEIPHTPYYGSVDATPLWLMLLGDYHRWTGDDELVDGLWPSALAALRWIDDFGDADDDGFVEYRRHSRRGLFNQGWKDSGDAIRFRDGRLAEPPIALVEVQAYVFAARQAIARLARMREEHALADAQEQAAEELRERFEQAFWMAEEGTYAVALDGDKQQVTSLTSNPGHALWCGIVAPERAWRVAQSLTSPMLWSGWGVRTLGSDSVGYNPIGYHLGTVWPHDNGICAVGLARYGLANETRQVAGALLGAAAHFRDARLPELFCGFDREGSPLPVPYPVACSPQAWAAGAPFHALTAMLGMRADAGRGMLELVGPTLPDYVPSLRISDLRVGGSVVDLEFSARGSTTSVEVLHRSGDLDVVIRHR